MSKVEFGSQEWLERLEKNVEEKQGCSLAESFEKFFDKLNEGKFLLSDMKEILDKMSEKELKQPLNLEINGPMGPDLVNVRFTESRTMIFCGKEIPTTGPYLEAKENIVVSE